MNYDDFCTICKKHIESCDCNHHNQEPIVIKKLSPEVLQKLKEMSVIRSGELVTGEDVKLIADLKVDLKWALDLILYKSDSNPDVFGTITINKVEYISKKYNLKSRFR